MGDYIIGIHKLLQRVFELWFVADVLFPSFSGVILTYWISNIFTFRSLKLRAVDEVQYLRRRIYRKRGVTETSPKTEHDWIDIEVNFSNELEQIAKEMESFGFISTGRVIRDYCAIVRNIIRNARKVESVVEFCPDTRHPEAYDLQIDNLVRDQLTRYWQCEYLDFETAVDRLYPSVFELINCPLFAQWQVQAKRHCCQMYGRWRRFKNYLNGESLDW